MTKINLVIVDIDEAYLESIVDYIMCFHPHRFHVSAFSDRDALSHYVEKDKNSVDIFLVSSQMYDENMLADCEKLIIISTAGKKNIDNGITHSVMKYQHTEKLIHDILNIYAASNTAKEYMSVGNWNSTVIGVYSATGGAGKTTVAVALGSILSKNSMPVFYLNLENIPSTQSYFKGLSRESISNLFYYIREGNKNLPLKLEALRCIDEDSGIFYFTKPDSVLDMEEIDPDECGFLIRQLRDISLYNFIIVDLSSVMNEKTIKILGECDEILYIHTENAVSQEKKNQLEKVFEQISLRNNTDFTSKITFILNKFGKSGMEGHSQASFLGKKAEIRILFEPLYSRMKTSEVISDMEREVEPLAQRLIRQKSGEG